MDMRTRSGKGLWEYMLAELSTQAALGKNSAHLVSQRAFAQDRSIEADEGGWRPSGEEASIDHGIDLEGTPGGLGDGGCVVEVGRCGSNGSYSLYERTSDGMWALANGHRAPGTAQCLGKSHRVGDLSRCDEGDGARPERIGEGFEMRR